MYSQPNRAHERTPINRGRGITASEQYLQRLCERSFLSLWSYPGIFRDQGRLGEGNGKEICDMLVICGEHVIIFSDKYCDFPVSDDLQLDWKRWYRRAIKKSADQAWGAERWIKTYPERVYLDRACTQKFPLQIPSLESARYHIIVVAHGCESRCKSELGGRGSLMLDSTLGVSGEQSMSSQDSVPFTIGDLDRQKTFVHVLNDSTLDIVLNTLDTITDFVDYLDKKENLFRSTIAVLAAGEEDLLALYLKKINDAGKHDFVLPESVTSIMIEEGHWEEFCQQPERIEQLRQDEISYAWDTLIERFSHHVLTATQYYTNHTELASTEMCLRFMALESRFDRRIISKRLLPVFTNIPDAPFGAKRAGAVIPKDSSRPYYVFLALSQPKSIDEEKYRHVRGVMLEACCMVLKYKFPNAQDIVGIASEPYHEGGYSSEDLLYLDARDWTEEQNEEAKRLQREFNIFQSPRKEYIHEEEYPDPPMTPMEAAIFSGKVGRNEKCPCGSGKKYKYCHGKKT